MLRSEQNIFHNALRDGSWALAFDFGFQSASRLVFGWCISAFTWTRLTRGEAARAGFILSKPPVPQNTQDYLALAGRRKSFLRRAKVGMNA